MNKVLDQEAFNLAIEMKKNGHSSGSIARRLQKLNYVSAYGYKIKPQTVHNFINRGLPKKISKACTAATSADPDTKTTGESQLLPNYRLIPVIIDMGGVSSEIKLELISKLLGI